MSVITIIIAAAISAGISYALHIIDKDKNSMEKVRKYADKRQSDFEIYFKERQNELNTAKADVASEQMKAVAAVKRLEQQINEFEKLTENLKGDSNSVEEIEGKLNAYDKILNELVQMTAGVEENLENVKKESAIVDVLRNKLMEQKKNTDILEKRIPIIIKDFEQKNGEQLKAIGTRLLEEYDSRGEKIKVQLDGIESSAKKAVVSLEEKIDAVYQEAAERVEQLEDEAFKHLSQQAQARSDAYISEMKQKTSEMEKILAENQLKSENLINQRFNETQALVDRETDNLLKNMEEKTASVRDKYTGLIETVGNKSDQRVLDLQ